MGGFFAVTGPELGFDLHAGARSAARDRAIEWGVATDGEIGALLRALRSATDGGYQWVSSPFFLDLALRRPVAAESSTPGVA